MARARAKLSPNRARSSGFWKERLRTSRSNRGYARQSVEKELTVRYFFSYSAQLLIVLALRVLEKMITSRKRFFDWYATIHLVYEVDCDAE